MQIQKKTLALIGCIIGIFIIGFAGGFYLAVYMQGQTNLLAAVAIIFVFLIWFGSGVDILGFLRDMYREAREKPQLSIEHDEKGLPSVFAPEIQFFGKNKKPFTIQKFLKVRIKNSGGIARNCKGELRLIKQSESTIVFSEDFKLLTWDSKPLLLQMDIGAKSGSALLHVAFSDSHLEKQHGEDNAIYAFASTIDALTDSKKYSFFPLQHGFGIGDYEIEIIITSEDGSSANAQFRLHVDKDFRKLNMMKIS